MREVLKATNQLEAAVAARAIVPAWELPQDTRLIDVWLPGANGGGRAIEAGRPATAEPSGRRHEPPALILTKLRPPTPRKEWVGRERLFERLRAEPGVGLTAVIAPAGSGKTTLLATWLEAEAARRPVGWVSLDDGDSDPVTLWSHVLESLQRVCPALETADTPERVGADRLMDTFLPDLVNALTAQGETVLVLDDFHRVLMGPSRESVAWLAEHSPASFQLVISTRTEPGIRLGALRAHGRLRELRAAELGFTRREAEVFLNDHLALGLGRDQIDALVERTEGWATGLYLAALSLRGTDDREAFVNRFGGTSRHVVDFLIDEVLDAHSVAQQTLMVRCSVLERLSGPVCDVLLEQDGSAEQLTELARTNLFLVPLDDRGQFYRFHHLFRQLLRVELERREPGLAPTLHGRAYAWNRDHGSIDDAIEHAIEAGAFADAGDLIGARWIDFLDAGRHAVVLAWLERFPRHAVESNAVLLAVKAWLLSLSARRTEALEAIAAVERLDGLDQGPSPDGASSVEASIAALKATFSWGDVGSAFDHAVLAAELQRPEGPYWAHALWARGTAHFFRGELPEADRWLTDAASFASSVGMGRIAGSALAYRSFVAGAQGDIARQHQLAEQAMQTWRERHTNEIDGEVPAAVGASLAARGEFEEARFLFEQGIAVLRDLGQPLILAYALILQAPVLRTLGDTGAAGAALGEARSALDTCRDPGVLEEWLSAAERAPRRPSTAGSKLSSRELAVLRALSGPLSERDIAREFYLSYNTVHSHTRSIYRKLGVSSRGAAVRQARELRLL